MKQYLLTLQDKIDALSLRERVMVFAAIAGAVIFLLHSFMLDPLLVKQATLRAQIAREQNNVTGIDAEIYKAIQQAALDPDVAERARLETLQMDVARQGAALRAMQRGLVAPDKIASLLETLLKNHGRLRLLSLKTLPATGVSDGAFEVPKAAAPVEKEQPEAQLQKNLDNAIAASAAKPAVPGQVKAAPVPSKPRELLYRHGVEITLQGNYVDMVSYMAALESLPSQLFWAQAKLDAADYSKARLTLVLYTLSLDQKWIAL